LDLDDRLGRRELARQSLILLMQAGQLGRVDRSGRATPLVRREGGQCSLGTVAAPFTQMRGVETLTTQKCPQLSGGRTRVGLRENAQLVGSGELSTLRTLGDFGVRGR